MVKKCESVVVKKRSNAALSTMEVCLVACVIIPDNAASSSLAQTLSSSWTPGELTNELAVVHEKSKEMDGGHIELNSAFLLVVHVVYTGLASSMERMPPSVFVFQNELRTPAGNMFSS